MSDHLYEVLAPIVTIASLTALSLLPLLGMHIAQAEQKIIQQREEILWHEKFLINCLSGRTMMVGKHDAVECVPL